MVRRTENKRQGDYEMKLSDLVGKKISSISYQKEYDCECLRILFTDKTLLDITSAAWEESKLDVEIDGDSITDEYFSS